MEEQGLFLSVIQHSVLGTGALLEAPRAKTRGRRKLRALARKRLCQRPDTRAELGRIAGASRLDLRIHWRACWPSPCSPTPLGQFSFFPFDRINVCCSWEGRGTRGRATAPSRRCITRAREGGGFFSSLPCPIPGGGKVVLALLPKRREAMVF